MNEEKSNSSHHEGQYYTEEQTAQKVGGTYAQGLGGRISKTSLFPLVFSRRGLKPGSTMI